MSQKNSWFKFRVINPAHYLDALLFWSVYVSSAMAIMWLLASTAKNQIREIMIEQLLAIEQQSIEILSFHAQKEGLLSSGEELEQALFMASSGSNNITAIGLFQSSENGEFLLLGEYSKSRDLSVNFMSSEHVEYLRNTLVETRLMISDWRLFTSDAATLLTPPSSPIEYLYVSLPDENGQGERYFLVIAFDAALVQSSFYRVEEFAITAICLVILFATLIAILIRYRSVQRLQVTEEKLEALDLLGKRDVLLSLVVGAADELLGQKNVESVFLELLI